MSDPKLYNEQGNLSDYGEDCLSQYLDKEIIMILNDAKSETELRIIGSILSKRVNDLVSNRVRQLKK